jgi:serine protease Do
VPVKKPEVEEVSEDRQPAGVLLRVLEEREKRRLLARFLGGVAGAKMQIRREDVGIRRNSSSEREGADYSTALARGLRAWRREGRLGQLVVAVIAALADVVLVPLFSLSLILSPGAAPLLLRSDGLAAAGPRSPAAPRSAAAPASPFADVAERVLPTVVSLSTSVAGVATRARRSGDSGRGRGDFLENVFPEPQWEEASPASGSGFIVDSSGLVVTNYHVIEGSSGVTVALQTGERFAAKVVGIDTATDVALLRIEPGRALPAIEWGDSDAIRVGDWAIAIGNPFGRLDGSVTVGVISAKGRSNIDVDGITPLLQDFIQTDASINFGNSGGPLVDASGRVIGMNTAVSPEGQGIGFAIPSRLLRRTTAQLLREGRVARAFLGIYPQELTPALAAGRGLGGVRGVLVGQVLNDTPASRAGFVRGDVITRIAGRTVADLGAFRILIAEAPIGERVAFGVRRGNRDLTLEVTLSARTDQIQAMSDQDPPELEHAAESWLGMTIAEISPALREAWGIEEGASGLIITAVDEGSVARNAGVLPGALLQEVGDREVPTLADLRAAIRASEPDKKPVVLLLRRDGLTMFVALTGGQSPASHRPR